MIKVKLSAALGSILVLFFFLINCEELEDLLTTVSGKVYSENCKVVIAVKGESELFSYLDKISGIDKISLREPELFRGFDISIDEDSLYNITALSFGETYILAIVDDGLIEDELDTLDHVGFYAESDTLVTIPCLGSDSLFDYAVPKKMNIVEGVDENNIDIENFIEFRWFIKIYETVN